ncbi:MAG: Gfo/Idh/MocA family oxidoreductase, partial [Halanaerobium sp.]|nr:Gfo/Idh/MocA family oxidoreductase [Halanaerobium sp.]
IFPPGKFSAGWMVDCHLASLANFYHNIIAVKVKYPETPTFREAARSQGVIEACYQSAREGGAPVKPPGGL